MIERAQRYFDECEQNEKPRTVCGLALALGLGSRQALWEYEKRPQFFDSVKWIKLNVEAGYEERLHGNNPTGAIFALKNFDWTDKQEVQHSGGVTITATQEDAEI